MALLVALVGGCGTAGSGSTDGAATSSAPATAPATSVVLPTSPVDAGVPKIYPVPGYAYGDVEAGTAAATMATDLVTSIKQDTPGLVTGHTQHQVLKDGVHVLNLLLLQIDPSAGGDLQGRLFIEGLLQWAVGSALPEFRELTLSGQWVGAAHVTVDGDERAALVWPAADTIAIVVGRSHAEAEAFLTELIKARTT